MEFSIHNLFTVWFQAVIGAQYTYKFRFEPTAETIHPIRFNHMAESIDYIQRPTYRFDGVTIRRVQ